MKKLVLTLVSLFVVGWTTAQTGTHWTSITGNQYNMTVRGIIVIDGETQTSNQLEIGAFCGEECRGSRIAALFPPTGEYTVMLTIKSNVFSGETITFRIYDHASQQELDLQSESTLIFEHNTNQGSMGNWFPFVFTTPESTAFHFTTAGFWSNPSNWQGGALPNSTDEVFIDADCLLDMDAEVSALTVSDGQALTLQSGKVLTVSGDLVNTEVSGLVIEDGAQLINASVNVSATLEKVIVGYNEVNNPDGWYTIASPMDGMAIAASEFLIPEYDLYRYNETSLIHEEWENYKANNADFTTFEKGRGYLYANSNSFSPVFTGTLNNTAVTCGVTCTERPDALSGFNLIGNPFPHVIYKGAGGALNDANLASGYYTLTNEGAWHVHTYSDAIQPGQGFLVKTAAAGEVHFNKSNAVATAEFDGFKAQMGRLEINVMGSRGEDRCFAYLGQGIGLDKMENLSESAPMLWIRNDGRNYAIAHVSNQCETLDVMFRNKQADAFTLTVASSGLHLNYLHLIDNITGTDIDLLHQPNYTFQSMGQEYEARFTLVFKQNTGVEESQERHFCFVSDGMLYLISDSEHVYLTLTDVLGRVVKSMEAKNNCVSVSDLPSGVYVVSMKDDNKTLTQRIVVEK